MTGEAAAVRRRLRSRARAALRLFCAGLLLCALAPIYLWAALNLSGKLALCQTAPASAVLRGFDFGPLYLREGQACRYFVSMAIPEGAEGIWTSRFEVLDEGRQPVFREDEARIIGALHFEPGARARIARGFTLDRQSGYYYFRLSSADGAYSQVQQAVPVASLTVRQGVVSGPWLWLPALSLLLLGAVCLGLALGAIRGLGAVRMPPELELEPRGPYVPRAVSRG